MENVVWKERKGSFNKNELYFKIKLPDWLNENNSVMTITIEDSIWFQNEFVSKFWAFNRGVTIVNEYEHMRDVEEIKKETIKRLKQLFNL